MSLKNKLFLTFGLLALAGVGQADGDPEKGKTWYGTCAACHGQAGEGNQALNSPALAGQGAWYLKAQINKFKNGQRGSHADDVYGAQMRPMAMTLASDEAVEDVAAYIATFEPAKIEATLDGDAAAGKAQYGVCTACHGANAEGNQALNAPSLKYTQDWYQLTQLKNFKSRVRGGAAGDMTGMQMSPMAGTLADETAMKNVIAYILSL